MCYIFLDGNDVLITEQMIDAELVAEFATHEKALDFLCGWQAERILEMENEIARLTVANTSLETKFGLMKRAI